MSLQGGWQEHYFEPMKEYFANRTLANAEAVSKEEASKTRRKRTAPRRKSKRAAPRVKTRVGRKKSKRTIAASLKSKRAKKTKSKPAPRRRPMCPRSGTPAVRHADFRHHMPLLSGHLRRQGLELEPS
jgi:hypothetical protein